MRKMKKPWVPLPGAHCCCEPGLWRRTSPSAAAPFSALACAANDVAFSVLWVPPSGGG